MFKRQGITPVLGTDGCIDDMIYESSSVPKHESTFEKIKTYAREKKGYIFAGLALLATLAVAKRLYDNHSVDEPKETQYTAFGQEPDEREIFS